MTSGKGSQVGQRGAGTKLWMNVEAQVLVLGSVHFALAARAPAAQSILPSLADIHRAR